MNGENDGTEQSKGRVQGAQKEQGAEWEQSGEKVKGSTLRYVFPKTVPVMVGYIFLGTAYGILMSVNGFGIGWALAISIIVYAGSLQYVGINLLLAAVSPLAAFLMALMVNARHLFYGISMLGKYQNMGKAKPYLIFGLTDETFSVVCNEKIPEGIREERAYFLLTFLDQCYWVLGTLIGAAAGSVITFNTAGLDFALTALFVVIFTEQWMSQKKHGPALAGVACSVLCLWIFGPDAFIIPAMIAILGVVTAGYRREGRSRE